MPFLDGERSGVFLSSTGPGKIFSSKNGILVFLLWYCREVLKFALGPIHTPQREILVGHSQRTQSELRGNHILAIVVSTHKSCSSLFGFFLKSRLTLWRVLHTSNNHSFCLKHLTILIRRRTTHYILMMGNSQTESSLKAKWERKRPD